MNIWEFIKTKLIANKHLVLMVVVDSQGSSPGQLGFKMAVADDEDMIGSIGGGIMEYNLVEMAKKQFHKKQSIFLIKQEHQPHAASEASGMICSGSQQIAFYPINRSYLPIIESILQTKEGQLIFKPDSFVFNKDINVSRAPISAIKNENNWSFTEHLGYVNYLYIFGAGHVSVAVSKLFEQLGFYITVFDNRSNELTTFKNNTFAHSKQIIDYNEAAEYIPEGDHVYVVIMTFAHKDDRKILKCMLSKSIKYLGLMGSKEKISSIFEQLLDEGINEKQLNKVNAPIGLPINSQTPDEIAISIAAKVIGLKNRF